MVLPIKIVEEASSHEFRASNREASSLEPESPFEEMEASSQDIRASNREASSLEPESPFEEMEASSQDIRASNREASSLEPESPFEEMEASSQDIRASNREASSLEPESSFEEMEASSLEIRASNREASSLEPESPFEEMEASSQDIMASNREASSLEIRASNREASSLEPESPFEEMEASSQDIRASNREASSLEPESPFEEMEASSQDIRASNREASSLEPESSFEEMEASSLEIRASNREASSLEPESPFEEMEASSQDIMASNREASSLEIRASNREASSLEPESSFEEMEASSQDIRASNREASSLEIRASNREASSLEIMASKREASSLEIMASKREASSQEIRASKREASSIEPETSQEIRASKRGASPRPDSWLGIRHLQASLMFFGLLLAFTLRVNLSVAIVAMVDKEGANPDYPEYDWSEGTKGFILSSFAWGYVVTQVPASLLAQRYGAKLVLALAIIVASIFAILIPGAAAWGDWKMVCVFRFIQGIAEGFIFPVLLILLAKWTPEEERGVLVNFVTSGGELGAVVGMLGSGFLSTSAGGWPSTFYVFGGVGLGWALLWLALGSNSPAEDRLISVQERAYIQDSLRTSDTCSQATSTPWRAMLTSLPMWAMVFANCGTIFGFWILLDEKPTYMKSVLGYDLESNGAVSALPYMIAFLLGFVFGWTSDFVTNNNILTKTTSRKLFSAIGLLLPGVLLIALSYSSDVTLSIVLLTSAVGLNSAVNVGYFVSPLDMAPNFAGNMMGISHTVANAMGIIGPIIVGAVVTESTSVEQWRIVFFISAAVYIVTGMFYVLFGSAELQRWNADVK